MRIAWIVYGSLEQRTGGTIYDARIVAGLREHGDSVDVLSLEPGAKASRIRSAASALVRALRRSSPDVVVGDELCFQELAFVFSRASFVRRVLLVHHLTCWEEELACNGRRRARLSEAIALRNADAIVATSRATRARLVTEGCRTRASVVVPGADRVELLPRPERTTELRFLFVGAILPRKRVRLLVRAFASVPVRSVLRLAGSRERQPFYARDVDRLIVELGLSDRVSLLGEVDEPELARELATADALVMPSSLEGYGIAATEALRSGTPVIAARTPGLEEALAPCPEGRLFFESEADLASAMVDFATNTELRTAMQSAARRARMPAWSASVDAFRAALTAS